MKVFKKILILFLALIFVAAIGIFAACKIDKNFENQVRTFLKIEQPKKASAVDNTAVIKDLNSNLENLYSSLEENTKNIETLNIRLNEISSSSEENATEIKKIKAELASLNAVVSDIQNQISQIQTLLQEIQNSTHNVQAKMCNLKGGLSAVGSVTLGSVTMNCNGGTLIFLGTTCAKVDTHMGYVTLRIDNGEHMLMSAFDCNTGLISRPYFYLVEGVAPGEHTFTISVIGQNYTEKVEIANYTWAHGLFIEI